MGKVIVSLFFIFFMLSCSDSKPDKLIVSFSNDFNITTLDTNRTQQINVFAHYSDGSLENISNDLLWSSSDTSVATVNAGLVQTFSKLGSVDITYQTREKDTDGTPFKTQTFALEVKDLTLTAITLSSSSIVLSVGATTSITATGKFEDNSTSPTTISYQNITNDLNWSSADNNISSVVAGKITGVAEGNTTISASESNISATANVSVTKVHYTGLSISSTDRVFNVQQTLSLEARATTDKNETILLDANEVTYVSSDTTMVTVSTGIATAKAVGSATIQANITAESNITSSIVLTVNKANYLRIFKNGVEVDFPYINNESNATLSATLDSFILQAVGVDFVVGNLSVTDFSANDISSANVSFDGLTNGQTLSQDTNVSFELIHDGSLKELYYQFDINDSFGSKFEQKYYETD